MKKTELRDAQLEESGALDVRVNLLVLDDEGAPDEGRSRLHSIVIEPGADLDERLAAVNQSIANDLKWPALTPDEWQKVRDACAKFHTPEIVKAYAANKAAQLEAAEALAKAARV